jgi:hypothetical protein
MKWPLFMVSIGCDESRCGAPAQRRLISKAYCLAAELARVGAYAETIKITRNSLINTPDGAASRKFSVNQPLGSDGGYL